MAFPGARLWKIPLTIPHEMILGDIGNDGLFRKTHVDLPTNFLTLGHAQAPQDGGADIAASLDELGETQIPCYVVRCDLDSTPANSRVHIWFRRQDVSDTADTVIWLWYGSTTDTAPAATESYGRNDVFDGTTGTGAPVAAWGVWLFDEDPTDPSPCYIDVSGNGHGANDNGTVTRVDSMDVRGAQLTAEAGYITAAHTWAPGTADWSILWAGVLGTGGATRIQGAGYVVLGTGLIEISIDGAYFADGSVPATAALAGVVRDGATIYTYVGSDSHSGAGWGTADTEFASTFELASQWADAGTTIRTFMAFLDTAVNAYWTRALNDCLVSESTFWEVGEITAAAVQAVFTVSPIAVGSEVRYYEQPHPQSWTSDFGGLAVADQDGTYFLFQVMGSGGASSHYAWFDLDDGSTDPAVADRTGHEIDVATGDTDEDIAVAAATVLNAIADLTVTIVGTVVTVTNKRDGELEPPADAAGAATGAGVALVVVGGTSAEEITGIEESTATAWGGIVSVTRPREITIVIIRPGYEPIRLEGYVVQPASSLVPVSQRVDLNYSNPA
jgi:hypothetical protein